MSPKDTVIIIDLDHTLVKVNTSLDLLKAICKKRYTALSTLFYPLKLLNKISGRDFYKKALIKSCIGGMSKKDLEKHAKSYYEKIQKNPHKYYNSKVLSFLDTPGTEKILISGSLDMIVRNFKGLGFNSVISGQSQFEDGRFKSYTDISGKKHILLRGFIKKFDKVVIIDDIPEPEFSNYKKIQVIKVENRKRQ